MSTIRSTRLTLMVLAAVTIACTGCGAGGGGDGGTDAGGTTPPPVTTLGTADLLGTSVTVNTTSALTPGTTADFQIQLGTEGVGAPERIEVLFGDDYETAVPATTIASSGTNQWNATVSLPASFTTDSSVLVRVILADGNILESGREDFLVAGR